MKAVINSIVFAISLLMTTAVLAQNQIRSEIIGVTKDAITLANGDEYKVVKLRTHKHKKTVVVARGGEYDISLLAGVGHVDDALITVDGKVVTHIEVIRLDQ